MTNRRIASVLATLAFLFVAATDAAGPKRSPSRAQAKQLFFDDFHYASQRELTKNGWIVRAEAGWPGIPGAIWDKEGISFLDDPETRGNRLLRMTASTSGSGVRTRQAQICHKRKYREGTYAARVRFTDAPIEGPEGDHVVETFYMISPQKAPMDLDYSEIDFEYLPFGGWGRKGATLFATTWETFQLEPWKADNESKELQGKKGGWHTLVTHVGDAKVTYYVDGELFAEHGGRVYPESMMSINFNLWFIKDGLLKSDELRRYQEDIDWVYFEAASLVPPREVEARVKAMRRSAAKFRDTVRPPSPPLPSPCNF